MGVKRKQLMLVSAQEIDQMAAKAYQSELSKAQKAKARAAAKTAGRPYPNLVDNIRAARKSKG